MSPKIYKFLLVVFICSFFSPHLFSQVNQTSSTGSFKIFFEKVYLHIDRQYYSSGDDIWFKAYLVNGQNNHTLNTSNNLYVELIDPKNTIVTRRAIRLDKGIGVGDFILGDSIEGGTYRIRAYTNWMRNFGSNFVFEKPVYVHNVFPASTGAAEKTSRSASKKTEGTRAENKIQFLPEGGSMVAGLNTVVAFKAEDAKGNGLDAQGSIVSSKGDTVARFKSTYLGMGIFPFKPEPGGQYKAVVRFKGQPALTTDFPTAFTDGFVMNITDNNDADIIVNIAATEATVASGTAADMILSAKHGGKVFYRNSVVLKEGKALISIPKNDFPSGIAAITLHDAQLKPYSERLVYIDKLDSVNIAVTTDKSFYNSKEKVTVNISATDLDQKPVKAALSLAAVDDDIVKAAPGNIATYLLLESELKGKIENVASYFDKNNSKRLQQLDLLLRTQGWRDFLWRRIADTAVKISYLPEPGVTISGKVVTGVINKPLANMNITLVAPGAKGDKIYMTKSYASGQFFLDGLPLYGSQSIKLNSSNEKGKISGRLFIDTLFGNPMAVQVNNQLIQDSVMITKRFADEAARRFATGKSNPWYRVLPNVTVTNKISNTITLRDGMPYKSFGYPEYNYDIGPQDFQYKTVQDFIVQKVPGARYAEGDGVTFSASGKELRPRVIVDKQEDVFERLDYYQLPMSEVSKISVRHYVGMPRYERSESDNGRLNMGGNIPDVFLVYLSLKPGALNQNSGSIRTDITGYYEARVFYAPNYAAQNESKPDARTTIHWSPFINTDEEGKATITFYNADPKSNIRIDVQGLTEKGVPIVATAKYQVK